MLEWVGWDCTQFRQSVSGENQRNHKLSYSRFSPVNVSSKSRSVSLKVKLVLVTTLLCSTLSVLYYFQIKFDQFTDKTNFLTADSIRNLGRYPSSPQNILDNIFYSAPGYNWEIVYSLLSVNVYSCNYQWLQYDSVTWIPRHNCILRLCNWGSVDIL